MVLLMLYSLCFAFSESNPISSSKSSSSEHSLSGSSSTTDEADGVTGIGVGAATEAGVAVSLVLCMVDEQIITKC